MTLELTMNGIVSEEERNFKELMDIFYKIYG